MSATDRKILGAPRSNPPPSTLTIAAGQTVLIVGDSIPSTTWLAFAQFQTDVDAHFSGLGAAAVTWVNTAWPSSGVTALALTWNDDATVAARITPYNPDVMISAMGVNDMNDAGWDQPTFEAAYRSFISKALAAAPKLAAARILLTSLWFGGSNDLVPKANECLIGGMNIARAAGTAYVDYRTNRIRTGGQTVDGIHPTSAGKLWLSARLLEAVTLVP